MKKNSLVIVFAIMLFCVLGCDNTYKLAEGNYSGYVAGPSSNCEVVLVNNEQDMQKAVQYVEQHGIDYLGSTVFRAKANFSRKHVKKLCMRLGGEYAIATFGTAETEVLPLHYASCYESSDDVECWGVNKVKSSKDVNVTIFGKEAPVLK